jgi:hypothetical protein
MQCSKPEDTASKARLICSIDDGSCHCGAVAYTVTASPPLDHPDCEVMGAYYMHYIGDHALIHLLRMQLQYLHSQRLHVHLPTKFKHRVHQGRYFSTHSKLHPEASSMTVSSHASHQLGCNTYPIVVSSTNKDPFLVLHLRSQAQSCTLLLPHVRIQLFGSQHRCQLHSFPLTRKSTLTSNIQIPTSSRA